MENGTPALFVRAIHSIYREEVTKEDREKAVLTEPGTVASVEPNQVIPTAKVTAEEVNRYEALRFIYNNWKRIIGEAIDTDFVLLLIEMHELLDLWRSRREHTCIIRAASFFESYFIEKTGISSQSRLGSAIDAAAARDIVTPEEKKLFHFIREVRNECSHNSWLEVEFPRELLVYTCTTSNFLIERLAMRKLDQLGAEMESMEAKPEHLLAKLEQDFQWECTVDDDGNVDWEAPDSWTHPEDGKVASYEEYWASDERDDSE